MQAVPSGRGVATQIPLFTPAESPRDVNTYAISRPAREFTGDFYLLERRDDTFWVVIGDVAGKGLEAAVVMAMIQEQLEEQIAIGSDAAYAMERLHLTLRDILPGNKFATLAIAQIRDDGRVTIVNGGHPPPMIARRDGTIETVGSTGPVVGLISGASWRSIELPFRRGDTLLAYTDGVTEARNGSGEEFGVSRVRDAFATARGTSTHMATAVVAALDAHGCADDDVTIIAAQR